MSGIESPGSSKSSKGSKSSSGLDDLYFSLSNDHNLMKYAEIFDPLTNNDNIGTNYFTDVDPNVGLDIDDIDEIDTNNMAIYDSGTPAKRPRGKELFTATPANGGDLLKRQDGKQQSKTIFAPQKTQQGKSLIKNDEKALPQISIDVPNEHEDVLAQAVDAANISPNSFTGQSLISNFDEDSRVIDT